jgi:4-hydroxy-2-oxoheptanedioate aldolase
VGVDTTVLMRGLQGLVGKFKGEAAPVDQAGGVY